MEEKKDDKKENISDNEKNIGLAVTAYFLFFIPLLTDSKDNAFVKFHVKQGLLLFILSIAYYVLRAIPFVGYILWEVRSLFMIGYFVLLIMGILNAINGETKHLPLIGKYADTWFKF